jgi:hypothetical protein
MKAQAIQIVWHGKKPVFSIDADASGRIATGGADNDVKLWTFDGERVRRLNSSSNTRRKPAFLNKFLV